MVADLKRGDHIICVSSNSLFSRIIDWILITSAVVLLIIVFLSSYAEFSDQSRHNKLEWSFGERLSVGDFFKYKICDTLLKVPESPDQCYMVTMEFLHLLPTIQGNTWVVAAHIDHRMRQVDMILQISDDSFAIRTDGSTIPYASSIQRTIGWINQYATKFDPQPLSVGSSWGMVPSSESGATDLLVTQIDSINVANQTYKTYRLGYSTTKESLMQIKDDFPFPIKAAIYKPIKFYQNAPLTFTVELVGFSRVNSCYPHNFEAAKQNMTYTGTITDTYQHDLMRDPSFEISAEQEIENNQTDGDAPVLEDISSGDYKKLEQFFGNVTRFLKSITDTANQIIENQTKNEK